MRAGGGGFRPVGARALSTVREKAGQPTWFVEGRRSFSSREPAVAMDEERAHESRPLEKTQSINSGVSMVGKEYRGKDRRKASSSNLMNSLLSGDVHGSYLTKTNVDSWRKRPLLNRPGKSLTFTSGEQAAELLLNEAKRRDPYQTDFLECVEEVAMDCAVRFEDAPKLAWVFKQLMEPERLTTFRIPWTDDNHNKRIHRGYRIQYSSALGPFHGGVRFHPFLSHGVVRMLGWEQTLKNALTGSNIGGSHGGSDFDPAGKSEGEIQRFCESYMEQASEIVGPQFDTMQTDIGVGASVIKHLHLKYTKEYPEERGVDKLFGAYEVFPQSHAFGAVYFAERALEAGRNESLEGKRCIISGASHVSRSLAYKLMEKGALPVSFSDDSGFIYNPHGFSEAEIDGIAAVKKSKGKLKDFSKLSHVYFEPTGSLWEQTKGDIAFPCTLQGEVNSDDATFLAENGCIAVFENTDRACTANAQVVLEGRGVLFAPSKAVTAGAAIVSAEMEGKNAQELDTLLKDRMVWLHDSIAETAEKYATPGNLRAGANLSSFIRIANSFMFRDQN